jgi:hypothetical protein
VRGRDERCRLKHESWPRWLGCLPNLTHLRSHGVIHRCRCSCSMYHTHQHGRELPLAWAQLQPHVGWLDVAVEEAARVRVAQRREQVAEKVARLPLGKTHMQCICAAHA